ncbi:DNA polymerase II [Pleionea sp. CnH1-48]|uniref:DNA polymerase II n=1 Tax=Pleionea sp. CnH1-48 TaxID=2954494 RepID=UPI00209812DA|nr:DNA polymerase II [Pleionea sp. CnH1-48]MCO7223139.1 DNA polymerase II [Pleionea sp. CnH1-48]
MMNQNLSTKCFLLTRHWNDHPVSRKTNQLQLDFWAVSDRGPIRVIYPQQKAVFFIEQDQLKDVSQCLQSSLPINSWQSRPLELVSFTHQPITAIYFNEQRHLYFARRLLRDQGLQPLEADIQPTDRFLMERFITGSFQIQGDLIEKPGYWECVAPTIIPETYQPSYCVVSIDIETDMRGEQLYSIGLSTHYFGTPKKANSDSQTSSELPASCVMMIGRPNPNNKKEDDLAIVWCDNEHHLLRTFLHWLEHIDPDIMIGWNVVNFDFRVLQKAADRLKVPFTIGRGQTQPEWRQTRDNSQHHTLLIEGRLVLDGIDTLRSATYNFESFSLQNVANEVLDRGKLIHNVDDRGQEITRLFHHDKEALAAYNLEDCKLVWDIFERTQLLEFAIERAQLTGLAMDRFGGSVASFDNRYLPRLHRAGFIAPNVPTHPEDIGSPGGYVMDSFPGIYHHVLVLDFKSLYPSIIRTFKIDPLALVCGVADEPHQAIKNREETQVENTEQLVAGYNGALFSKEKALLPDIIGELWQARDVAKQQKNAAMSQAIKILMNSFYGVLGTPGCRFFDFRLPSSITLRGHFILYTTQKLIEEQGYKVIYGDTDSVFVWLKGYHPKIDSSSIRSIGEELADTLNAWWKNYLTETYNIDSYLEIEFETHFQQFVMPTIRGSEKGTKKRYAGLAVKPDQEPELVFKGLETVRTDWTMIAREFQRELYRRVFFNEAYEEYIIQIVEAIRNGEHDEQLIYRKRIRRRLNEYQKNVPPHVQAARIAEQHRSNTGQPSRYQNGGWIQYYLTVNGPEPLECRRSQLDYDLYIERQIEPICDGILHFLDTSFRQITDRQIDLFG